MFESKYCQQIICVFRGMVLMVKSWLIEVLLWMLMNNFDFDVVENLYELVVYGGIGCVVCNWECYDVIVDVFIWLEVDEMLFIQFGKLVGVFKMYDNVLWVLIVNFNLVFYWVI